jgi:hypothetical protein
MLLDILIFDIPWPCLPCCTLILMIKNEQKRLCDLCGQNFMKSHITLETSTQLSSEVMLLMFGCVEVDTVQGLARTQTADLPPASCQIDSI